MKTQVRLMVGTGIVAPLLVFGTAFATDSPSTTTDSSTTNTSTTNTGTTSPQLTAAEKQDLETRLQDRENTLKLKLTTADQLRIKGKCNAAQGRITSFTAKVKNIGDKRVETYGSLVARLSTLADNLSKQSVNVTTLNSEIATLETKDGTFKTDFTAYQQAITDLSDIDCVNDPTGFQTSLQTARNDQVTLQKDSQDIKMYVTQTIKPTLEKLRQALSTGTSTTSGGNQ